MSVRKVLAVAVATLASLVGQLHAATISVEAFDNATVQPAGPRAGANGKNFFNMEGTTAGGTSFRSFGVADFSFGSLGIVASVSNVRLLLTESNAAFTAPGNISVYPATNTASNIIQPGDPSQVIYQDDLNGLGSVDPVLVPVSPPLSTFAFPTTGNVNTGQVDTIPLSFDPAQVAAFLAAINSGSTYRIVITPDVATVAATYAGFSNTTLAGPTIAFDYENVPEPTSWILISLALPAILGRRRVS